MATCKSCGKPLILNGGKCAYCGADPTRASRPNVGKQDGKCSHCNTSPRGQTLGQNNNEPEPLPTCPKCGKHLPAGAKFCPNCGASLLGQNTHTDPSKEPFKENDLETPLTAIVHGVGESSNVQGLPKSNYASRFEWAESFSEGLAMVVIDGKTGFIDKTGKMVIGPKYNPEGSYMGIGHETCHGFFDGLAVVSVGDYPNEKFGCIDCSGNFVIAPNYDCIVDFAEGFAAFRNGDKWGFLDKRGNIVIPPTYESVSGFSEGLAVVKLGYEHYGYIDETGRMVLEKTKNMVSNWDEGFPIRRAAFCRAFSFHEDFAKVECFKKNGFIDKTGKFMRVKSIYYSNCDFSDFSEGLAVFIDDDSRMTGYINKDMRVVIEPEFRCGADFHEGLARIAKDKVGFIDKKGNIQISCQFDYASSFNEGMAIIQTNGKIGYIDKSGTIVISPTKYESARCFSEGLAAVKENGKWGYIDKVGNYAF